jgi:hypothetical protein
MTRSGRVLRAVHTRAAESLRVEDPPRGRPRAARPRHLFLHINRLRDARCLQPVLLPLPT